MTKRFGRGARMTLAVPLLGGLPSCGGQVDPSSVAGQTGGAGGAGQAGNLGTDLCVDVSHADDLQREELEVIGTGFDEDDGNMIRVVVTLGEPTYGLGEAPIRDGSFDIVLPGVLGDYAGLGLYVDRVRNGACDPEEEVLWQVTTGPLSALGPFISERNGRAAWEVTPDTLTDFEAAGPCNINGIFDTATALYCEK